MINLAISQKKENTKTVQMRSDVVKVTTVILVLWVLVLGGFFGWSWYVDYSGSKLSQEIKNLNSQISGRSEDEILIRTLADRTNAVKNFLDTRGEAVKHLDVVLLATPPATAWEYKNSNVQTITVTAPTAEEINTYTKTLSAYYSSVKIDSLVTTKDLGWTGVISVGGLKP